MFLPACSLLAAWLAPARRHPVRIKIATGIMNIASQLAALFGRQAIASILHAAFARRNLIGTLLGLHHPLRASTTTARTAPSLSMRSLSQHTGSQKPQHACHTSPDRPTLSAHNPSFVVISGGYCKPARPQSDSLPSGYRRPPAVPHPIKPVLRPTPCLRIMLSCLPPLSSFQPIAAALPARLHSRHGL